MSKNLSTQSIKYVGVIRWFIGKKNKKNHRTKEKRGGKDNKLDQFK